MIGVGIGVNKGLSNRKMIGGLVTVADLVGKISGSTVENPHIFKQYRASTLINNFALAGEVSNYANVQTLNGTSWSYTTGSFSGEYAQHLFSFDLIRHVEDRFKAKIPRTTVADKVQWIKDNVTKITGNWHGFGSSPTGNKAWFDEWNVTTNSWYQKTNGAIWNYHTSSNVVKISMDSTVNNPGVSNSIDANGFVHFLAYADLSNGTTASTINTDYINLEIEYKNGAYVL